MKKTYSVGELTKQKIFQTAKELFYEKGYVGTSFEEIANRLDINKGLIAYHFKNKYMLANQIYYDIEKDLHACIYEKISTEGPALICIFNLYAFHLLLCENRNYCRFCYEVVNNIGFNKTGLTDQTNFIEQFLDEAPIKPTPQRLHTLTAMSNGLDSEIIRGYYTGYIEEPVKDVLSIDITFILQQLGYSNKQIKNLLNKAIHYPYRLHMEDGFLVKCIPI